MYALDDQPSNSSSSTGSVSHSSSISASHLLDSDSSSSIPNVAATSLGSHIVGVDSTTSSNSNNNPSRQQQNSDLDTSYTALTHEQLKQLHLTFLQPSPPSPGVIRMQAPRRLNSQPQQSNIPASPTSQSHQQQGPTTQLPQPAQQSRVAASSSGTFLESGDYPLDFSPLPVQYTALNNNPAFLSGNLQGQQKVQAQAVPQQAMNRGVINQAAYPLQYRFASTNPDQKIPPQFLVHPASDTRVPIQHAVPQQTQPRQTQRKRKAQSTARAAAEPQPQPEEEGEEDAHQDAKRQKRLVKNRQAAQLFRQRQKQHIKDLEEKVAAVNEVNIGLTAKVDVLKAENKLVKDQLQYLRNFVSTALQCAFPQSKEELQKRWELFQQAESDRSEREPKEKSTSAAELLAASEKKEKRKHDPAEQDSALDDEDL